jgi:hypothetical protein
MNDSDGLQCEEIVYLRSLCLLQYKAYYFIPFFCARLWRGQVIHLSHGGNDCVTSGQKRKTYGRYLVRFFCKKVRLVPFFWASAKIPFATFTVSIIYQWAKNAPFI